MGAASNADDIDGVGTGTVVASTGAVGAAAALADDELVLAVPAVPDASLVSADPPEPRAGKQSNTAIATAPTAFMWKALPGNHGVAQNPPGRYRLCRK
jgi:hypothetical protein